MIIRRLFSLVIATMWAAVGAALAIEFARWMDRQAQRMRPSALTSSLLDKVNDRLEKP